MTRTGAEYHSKVGRIATLYVAGRWFLSLPTARIAKLQIIVYFHTPTYALLSYIIKSLKHFIHLTAPTCFDT
jgi:hypothetical protein